MLGELTLYATLHPNPVDSQVEQKISENYLFNTDCIIDLVDMTSFRRIRYKFHPYEDRTPVFVIDVTNSTSAIKTLADATAASSKVALSVFEDVQTFDLVTSVTAVTWNFNVADILWGENDPTDSYARIWVQTGGNKVTPYIVDHNISQIVDKVDTATTTTTSTSTSTTSTSSTSTSTTSTSSTSTSTTSTTSTSSTSTSSTSTTSTSTTTTIA